MFVSPSQLALLLQSHCAADESLLDQGNKLANQLIKNLQIQSGFGLAGFLNVDSHLDNFNAVRIWVNKQLVKLQPELSEDDTSWLYEELEHRFYDCMP